MVLQSRNDRKRDKLDDIIWAIVFGSVWGCFEATLGGFLHFIHFAHKGAVMGGIGISIMTAFVAARRRPGLVPLVGFVCALFKPLDGLILGVPIFAPFVINPATAIILEALAFNIVVSLLFKSFERSIRVRLLAGVAVGYLSITLYGILASAVGMGNWAEMALGERALYILSNGTGLAVIGAALLVVAYMIGARLQKDITSVGDDRPAPFYAGATGIAILCWVIAFFVSLQGVFGQ